MSKRDSAKNKKTKKKTLSLFGDLSFRLYKAAMVVKKNMGTQRIGNLEIL